ncbi:serine protease inhibitor 3/4 isoform X1 [Andrena cerasifolii]|uniref:serine protease inhibitor 3/4 isoform X1 n=2 Tax=Andrena cerasifolii TaxID=2819439 RepID=UPI0040379D00
MCILTRYLIAACLIAVAMANTVGDNQALRAVSQGTNAFSSQLFQTVVEENPGNLIMSPLSAAVVLAMAAYGARGETENQFKKVLHLPSTDSLGTSGYQALIDNINNVKENTLVLANKVFTAEKFSVKPSYRELTETYFRSITQLVNFAKSDEAAATINTWVKENTNNRIDGIVSASDLDETTALVLVNAVYFKGQWRNKFNPTFTRDMPFHINEQTVKNVPTMHRQGSYRYGELPNLNAKFVEIPYQGNELSMVIILPNEINGLPMVEKKLQGMSIADILKQGYEREVQLQLPKFKIEKKIDLNSVLEKMGLTDMFTAHANFSGIADNKLAVSKVVQKAFIEVNEEGSEAAAVTGVILTTRSMVYRTQLMIDHPFVYSIVSIVDHPETGDKDAVPIFVGHVLELDST